MVSGAEKGRLLSGIVDASHYLYRFNFNGYEFSRHFDKLPSGMPHYVKGDASQRKAITVYMPGRCSSRTL